jgi:hypothetical protein
LDEAAGMMFSQLCSAHGLVTRVEGPGALATANVFRLETAGVALLCLSYLSTSNAAHIRYAVRRVRRKFPRAIILVGCWNVDDDPVRMAEMLEATKADMVCNNLRAAARFCVESAEANNEQRNATTLAPATVSDTIVNQS